MPEEHKAESIVVRPTPATSPEVEKQMQGILTSVTVSDSIAPLPADRHYEGGFEGGLALAIDHGLDVAKKVLAVIDAKKRRGAAEDGDPDPDGSITEDAIHRSALMSQIADAAEGRPVRNVHAEITRLGGDAGAGMRLVADLLREMGSEVVEDEPETPEFRWN